jgi:uncharacterized protein (TIGR00730 family)
MKSICIYCGSNRGARPEYVALARDLGTLLARRGITLVYGAGNIGLMGVAADAALAAGGQVVGVIPRTLVKLEVAHTGLSELIVVNDMHERKLTMANRADGFIALPGGIGTLEELFETWTWLQLGFHGKPIALLDVAGYYTSLLAFLDHMVGENFLKAPQRDLLISGTDPAEILAQMAAFSPPQTDKWFERSQLA